MPNTPIMIGQGLISIVENKFKTDLELAPLIKLFADFAEVIKIKEAQLPLSIALAGSAPAFYYYFIDAMLQHAKANGMSDSEALKIIGYVSRSASEMVIQSDQSPEQLIKQVCSPNGATAQGIKSFDDHHLQALIRVGLDATMDRSTAMMSELNALENQAIAQKSNKE